MKNINKKPIDPRENENKNRRMKSIFFFFGKKKFGSIKRFKRSKEPKQFKMEIKKPNQKNGQKKIVNL